MDAWREKIVGVNTQSGSQDIRIFELPQGMTLLVEPMRDVQSAACSLWVPGGSIYDGNEVSGCATVLGEMLFRGAGEWDSHDLLNRLDFLGVQHSEGAERQFVTMSGAMLAENLASALEVFAKVVRDPHLPEEEFEPVVAGARQTLDGIEDEPRQKVMVELRRRCYPAPWGVPSEGSYEGLDKLTHQDVVQHYRRTFGPEGAILGVAGKVNPEEVRQIVEKLFGDWVSPERPTVTVGSRGAAIDHLSHDSTQTQIGLAYDSVPYSHPEYFEAWGAVSVLSGGSSSRLFTEVREKRGLCYSVYATLHSLKQEARVLCYAGSTSERAQETLDVMLQEIHRLSEGIGEDELLRCKARAKSSLIMQQESSSARAGSLVSDWHHLRRVTTLEELHRRIDGLSVRGILDHLQKYPVRNATVLTLGPAALEVPA